jgi:hypothetical protein
VRPLVLPPADLTDFPSYVISPSQELYRIHRAANNPWWFSHSGKMRFDLRSPDGSCYLAEDELAAFIEVFQDFVAVPRAEVDFRRMSRLRLPQAATLADCTQRSARRFGITGEIHASVDRATTQAWAMTFRLNGFDGIRYLVRHDPSQSLVGIALFGNAGEAPWPIPTPQPIDADLIARVEQAFGIRVV